MQSHSHEDIVTDVRLHLYTIKQFINNQNKKYLNKTGIYNMKWLCCMNKKTLPYLLNYVSCLKVNDENSWHM